jgi:hypothetical protein
MAENGCYVRLAGGARDGEWEALVPHADYSWKKMALPILQQYQVRAAAPAVRGSLPWAPASCCRRSPCCS